MKVYISGQIADSADCGEQFEKRARIIRNMGLHPVNPFSLNRRLKKQLWRSPTEQEQDKFLLPFLCGCDGITFLDGWEKCGRARLERVVASRCGIRTVEPYPTGCRENSQEKNDVSAGD